MTDRKTANKIAREWLTNAIDEQGHWLHEKPALGESDCSIDQCLAIYVYGLHIAASGYRSGSGAMVNVKRLQGMTTYQQWLSNSEVDSVLSVSTVFKDFAQWLASSDKARNDLRLGFDRVWIPTRIQCVAIALTPKERRKAAIDQMKQDASCYLPTMKLLRMTSGTDAHSDHTKNSIIDEVATKYIGHVIQQPKLTAEIIERFKAADVMATPHAIWKRIRAVYDVKPVKDTRKRDRKVVVRMRQSLTPIDHHAYDITAAMLSAAAESTNDVPDLFPNLDKVASAIPAGRYNYESLQPYFQDVPHLKSAVMRVLLDTVRRSGRAIRRKMDKKTGINYYLIE